MDAPPLKPKKKRRPIRYQSGEVNRNAKLKQADVDRLRNLRAANPRFWTFRRLAAEFKISVTETKRIVDRAAWT